MRTETNGCGEPGFPLKEFHLKVGSASSVKVRYPYSSAAALTVAESTNRCVLRHDQLPLTYPSSAFTLLMIVPQCRIASDDTL
jgi:hypothetical protein